MSNSDSSSSADEEELQQRHEELNKNIASILKTSKDN